MSIEQQSNVQSQPLQPIFLDIKADPQPIRIQSLCVSCGKDGETILLLTKIPFFKELLLGSFSCEHCGNKNSEVQFVGELPKRGLNIRMKVQHKQDLDREVILSQYAVIGIQDIGLQGPRAKGTNGKGKAKICTIEGILKGMHEDISQSQQFRRTQTPQIYNKIQQVLSKLTGYLQNKTPFTLTIHDPSGHSTIKNPQAPKLDPKVEVQYFTRNKEQLMDMGYSHENAVEHMEMQKKQEQEQAQNKKQKNQIKQQKVKEQEQDAFKKMDLTKPVQQKDFMHNELSVFQIICHACQMPGLMKLCQTNIPHFSDIIIMSFNCQFCGAHSTETKNSGQITDKSTTLTITVSKPETLKRDLFKSQTCSVKLPELDIELDYGTLGGVYTTIEGLLEKIKDHMEDINTFTDSDDNFCNRMREILENLDKMMSGLMNFQLILDDPLSNTFISNPYAPAQDKDVKTQTRDRSQDQKDFLGINQMHV